MKESYFSFVEMPLTVVLYSLSFIQHERVESGEYCLCITRLLYICLLYTSPSPRDGLLSRMPSSA